MLRGPEGDATLAQVNVFKDSPPTLREIAAAADVSVATVSLALRGNPRITAATQAKVRAAADRLGHAPSPLVSAFMSRIRRHQTGTARGETFAVLLPPREERDEGFTAELRAGFREQAARLGLGLDEFRLEGQGPTSARRLERILHSRGIRGLLVAPSRSWDRVIDLDWSRFAAVSVGYSLKSPALHIVAPDHQQGMRVMITCLRERGCLRLGYFADEASMRAADKRFLARFALYTTSTPGDVDIPPLLIPAPRPGDAQVRAEFLRWFRRYRPVGIISTFSQVPAWLESEGIAVPGDVHFCHENLAEAGRRPVAGLDQRPRLVAATAVNVLLSAIIQHEYGPPETPVITLIPGRWVDGPTSR